MRFSDFPFLRYLPFLLLGIFVGKFLLVPLEYVITALVLLWLVYFFSLFYFKKKFGGFYSSILAYVMLVIFGIFLVGNRDRNKSEIDWTKAQGYLAEVIAYDEKKPNSFENLLEIQSILISGNWSKASGKVLVYHQMGQPLVSGTLLWIESAPETIDPPKNPFEFNYSEFLKRKGISYRQFLRNQILILGKNSDFHLAYFFDKLRFRMSELLESKIKDPESIQVAQALLLGQKQFLDQDIKDAYSKSGVMHILAVSGLHVGIIYALLIFIIKPFKLKKRSIRIYLAIVIILIWGYAILTGMSPSVVRAATMFSLITMGQMRDRRPSIFNVLAFSALLMIAINPDVVFDVGFQLSYLAVFGIVLLQPKILNYWNPPTKWLEYIWQIIAVSIAAQLATFPLTIFYFHSFPTYFLFGNLLVIPLAFITMQVGVPLLIFGWIPYLSDLLGFLVSKLIWLQIYLIDFIQFLPKASFERLSISVITMFCIWLALFIWISWDDYPRKKLVWIGCLVFFVGSISRIIHFINTNHEEIIFYHSKSGVILDHSIYGETKSWNGGVKLQDISFQVDPYRIEMGWNQVLEELYTIDLGDSLHYFPLEKFKVDQQNKTLILENKKPEVIQKWENGAWEEISFSSQISFQETPIRVLF